MTQTARRGLRRPGAVYGINLLDPQTMTVRIDYVGQTRQRGRAREMQHRDSQPWEDLIVGSPLVLAEGVWTDDELDAQEQAMIRRIMPRMNYEYNLHNPRRIEIWRQREQRWARDDAANRPRWVPLEGRQVGGLLGQPVGIPVNPVRRAGPARQGGFKLGCYWTRMIRFLRSD